MLLGRELPSWEQIIKKGKGTTARPYTQDEGDLLYSRSWMSIREILESVRIHKQMSAGASDEAPDSASDDASNEAPYETRITVWLPDYLCNETICCFKREWMDILYFPIDERLDPDWEAFRSLLKDETVPQPDVILMAHYFGVYHDIAKMRDLANNAGAVLIEDCAHCLYPHPLGQIGAKGDFVIYSRHKQLPISDGAVLHINPDSAKKDLRDRNAAIAGILRTRYESTPRAADMGGWYAKKGIQKLIPLHRSLTYSFSVHYGVKIEPDEPVARISEASERILAGYDYEAYKRIAYLRRDNLRVMNAVIKKRIPDIRILNQANDLEIPYMAVYSMADIPEEEKSSVTSALLRDGYTVLYWPDLPEELTGLADEGDEYGIDHSRAFRLSRDIFVLPAIHQDVKPQQLTREFMLPLGTDELAVGSGSLSDDTAVGSRRRDDGTPTEAGPTSILDSERDRLPAVRRARLALEWEQESTKDEIQTAWRDMWERVSTTNIPQDYIYGDAKSATEGWGLMRAIVRNESSEPVGVIQILLKRIGGVTVAARVNRGPVLLPGYDCIENQLDIMRALRARIPHPIPIAWAPFIVWTPEHIAALTKAGWRATDPYAYPSGYLDLTQSEEDIEKNMKSFWRKHIKQAKKQVTIRINEYSAAEVMALYAQFLERRQIPGIPDHILKYLFALEHPPLEVLTAHNEAGEMIAYKVLYRHGNTGTSFIAWNTDEGRDKQARTLLIYTSAIHLKTLGCRYYDLGGIDDITTEAVAKYKRGTGDTDYRLQGEFLHI